MLIDGGVNRTLTVLDDDVFDGENVLVQFDHGDSSPRVPSDINRPVFCST